MKQLQSQSVVIKKFKPGYSLSDHINRKNLIQTEPTKKNIGLINRLYYLFYSTRMGLSLNHMDRYTKKSWYLGNA
ncbi:hypothetical protein ICE98_00382 [Lactococcus lactis]|nr:hypothetical protein [Lactococcus lactis]